MMKVTRARLLNVSLSDIPSGVWLLLALAVLFVINVAQTGYGFEPARLPSAILVAGPFFFAAAVVYAVPRNSMLVVGAVLLVVNLTIRLVELLIPAVARGDLESSPLQTVLNSAGWIPALAGYVLLGLGVGSVLTRRGWLIVAAFLVVAAVQLVGQLVSLSANGAIADAGLLILSAFSTIGLLVIVAISYLFAAALDHRLRFTALGAGIMLAVWLANFAMSALQLGPDTNFGLISAAFTVSILISWSALVYGALTELPIAAQQRGRASV